MNYLTVGFGDYLKGEWNEPEKATPVEREEYRKGWNDAAALDPENEEVRLIPLDT